METIDGAAEAPSDEHPGWRHYAKELGPGLITGASDDDPSGIATYAQSGAQFQYGLVWAALVTWPLMTAVQEVCDRTALTTGEGLDPVSERLEQLDQGFPEVVVVVDERDCHDRRRGKVTVKVAPSPRVDRTRIVPPLATMICWQIHKPRPMPA